MEESLAWKQVIRVSAAIIRDSAGRFLLVRKAGTSSFLFPGGKPEQGERPHQTLLRELAEELGLSLPPESLRYVGKFTTEAANEPETHLVAEVFEAGVLAPEQVAALGVRNEIAELRWFTYDEAVQPQVGEYSIAPLTSRSVLRSWGGRGMLLFTGAAVGGDPRYRQAVEELVHEVGRRGDYVVYGGGCAGLMGVIGDVAAADGTPVVGVMLLLLAGVPDTSGAYQFGGRHYAVLRGAERAGGSSASVEGPGGGEGCDEAEAANGDGAGGYGGAGCGGASAASAAHLAGEAIHPGLTRLELVDGMSERKDRMTELADAIVALPGGAGTLDELFDAWTQQQLGYHPKPVALLNVNGYWDPLIAMVRHMVDQGFVHERFLETLIVADDPEDLYRQLDSWEPPQPRWNGLG